MKITGFKIGNLEVTVESEGAAAPRLKEVLDALGIHQEGSVFIVNGERKDPATTTVCDTDTVEVAPKPKAGR